MLNQKLMGSYPEKLYVDDVFSTYIYTGNGSTQTINNGMDMAGDGGLVWIKPRTSDPNANNHQLVHQPNGDYLSSNNSAAITGYLNYVDQFRSDGFRVNTNAWAGVNYVSWTFRRAPKFFDVVTYTGNGVSVRQIPHELGVAPGMIASKSTSTTGDWNVYHRSATGDLKLNATAAQAASRAIITAASESTFTVSGVANTNGVSYVAYLWAHDPSEDGIIQCGSFTTDASGNATVNLGWEPQFVMRKTSSTIGGWQTYDAMRGMAVGGNNAFLNANESASEYSEGAQYMRPSATGFSLTGVGASTTYIYLAIRRPNKPPTSGTEVFMPMARVSTGATTVNGAGFAPDLIHSKSRGRDIDNAFWSRPLGANVLYPSGNNAEMAGVDGLLSYTMGGFTAGADVTRATINNSGVGGAYTHNFFRRTPGFMDVVCDTGTGAAHAISHNLTVAPELVIRKSRSASTQWEVWHSALAASEKLVLNSNAAKVTDAAAWNGTLPGASAFTVGTGANVNANGATFVAYLFSSLPGISKVGSYVGNGGSQTIDCGFSTGARFFLVKATSTTGSWWIFDSARGIISSFDPALQLNSAAAEITSADAVDPDPAGIVVNQEAACSINANGVSYVYLAIA